MQPVTYLSEELRQMTKGWPACLQALTATCGRLQEAEEFTLDQPHWYYATPGINIEQIGGLWLTTGPMGKYQAAQLDNPQSFLKSHYLSPDQCREP